VATGESGTQTRVSATMRGSQALAAMAGHRSQASIGMAGRRHGPRQRRPRACSCKRQLSNASRVSQHPSLHGDLFMCESIVR
jgi:hypothetical protein